MKINIFIRFFNFNNNNFKLKQNNFINFNTNFFLKFF